MKNKPIRLLCLLVCGLMLLGMLVACDNGNQNNNNNNNNGKVKVLDSGDLIFYCVFMAWPVLQFLVYYVGVNINSILMSFQFNTIVDEKIVTDYFSLEQYRKVLKLLPKKALII